MPKDDEYLATKSLFYFADMDFDGKEELVIVNCVSGGNKKENPPFDEIEQYFTKFDKSSQTIVNSVIDGVWHSAEYHYKKSHNGTFKLSKSEVRNRK